MVICPCQNQEWAITAKIQENSVWICKWIEGNRFTFGFVAHKKAIEFRFSHRLCTIANRNGERSTRNCTQIYGHRWRCDCITNTSWMSRMFYFQFDWWLVCICTILTHNSAIPFGKYQSIKSPQQAHTNIQSECNCIMNIMNKNKKISEFFIFYFLLFCFCLLIIAPKLIRNRTFWLHL